MSDKDFEKNKTNKKVKWENFWFLFFLIGLPILGIIIELIALKLESIVLMLIALPMLLSFFITAGVLFFQAFRINKKQKEAMGETEEEDDEYYESNLNMSEDALLSYEENPYKKGAVKALGVVAAAIFGPLLLAYLLKDTDVMIFGLYVKNICKGLSILLGMWALPTEWKKFADFFEFERSKKVALSRKKGEKKPLLLPRFNIISILFMLLAVVVTVGVFKDIHTLNEYKKNGVPVNAVSYHVERDGDDNYVYFKYTYEGKEYSYVKANYPGGTKIGNEVEAYIYPDNPEDLFIYYSNTFAIYIMLTGALFFLWMGNGYRKSILLASLLIEGGVGMLLGVTANAAGDIVWGVIFLIFAAWTLLSSIRKRKKISKDS